MSPKLPVSDVLIVRKFNRNNSRGAMTLATTSRTTSIDHRSANIQGTISDDDKNSQSDTSDDDVVANSLQPPMHPLAMADALVQCLGHPDSDDLPRIGCVQIDKSNDVHIGNKNIYQGPVTIRQIVYANGSAAIEGTTGDKGQKENAGFDCDSDISERFKASDVEVAGGGAQEARGFRKGYIWLQNVSKHRPMEIAIFVGVLVLFLVVLMLVLFLRHPPNKIAANRASSNNSEPDVIKPIEYDSDITATSQKKLRMISRLEWVAQPPINDTTPLVTPVEYVIIHHTATEYCSSQSQCVFHVRQIQTFHIESRGWYDIGYNFLVGGDGAAYEGRGWIVEGAHTLGWNAQSIGIAFIGTFISKSPPDIQLKAAQMVILRGIELGYIKKDYKLMGARQLFGTESPGTALLEIIKKWPHWTKEP